jgi:transcriptional regulator with XRE-family HTH domain
MNYELDIDRLRDAAAHMGDSSGYAIAQRTGLTETTVSRLLRRKVRPTVGTLLVLRRVYGFTLDDYVRELAA